MTRKEKVALTIVLILSAVSVFLQILGIMGVVGVLDWLFTC